MMLRTYQVRMRIGTRVKYAEPAHEGAQAHVILPRKKRGLSFKWDKAPRWMVTQHGKYKGRVLLPRVNHPGMKGTEFLTIPMTRLGTRRGFRTSRVRRSVR